MKFKLKVRLSDAPANVIDASLVYTAQNWNGIYVPRTDAEDNWVAVKQDDGTFKRYSAYRFRDRTTTNTYMRADVKINGKRFAPFIHKLKVFCKNNDPRAMQKGYNVDHIDQNSMNNRLSNLQVLTEQEHARKTVQFKMSMS